MLELIQLLQVARPMGNHTRFHRFCVFANATQQRRAGRQGLGLGQRSVKSRRAGKRNKSRRHAARRGEPEDGPTVFGEPAICDSPAVGNMFALQDCGDSITITVMGQCRNNVFATVT